MKSSCNLYLIRCRANEHGTFGRLFLDDVFLCYTLEPQYLPFGKPRAIPVGVYTVRTDIISPKYRFRSPYNKTKGCVPRLMNVPEFEGILIHIGNFLKDTKGCILVGLKSSLSRLFYSTKAYLILIDCLKGFTNINIKIENLSTLKYVRK